MPVFKQPGDHYSVIPWRNNAALIPTKKELRTNTYGRIPVPSWKSIRGLFNPPERREGEPTPPPRRGGGFPSYVINDTPLAKLQSRFGNVHGYEEGDTIWVGSELDKCRKLETVLHEYAAKLLREENPNFDHKKQHDKVYALVDRLMRHYKN